MWPVGGAARVMSLVTVRLGDRHCRKRCGGNKQHRKVSVMSENMLFTIEGRVAMVPLMDLLAIVQVALQASEQVVLGMAVIEAMTSHAQETGGIVPPEGLAVETADYYGGIAEAILSVWGPFQDEAVRHLRENGI